MSNPIKVAILGDAKGLTTALGKARAALTGFNVSTSKSKFLLGGLAAGAVVAGGMILKEAIKMDQMQKDFALSTGLIGEDLEAAFGAALDAAGQVPESIEDTITAAGNLQTSTGLLGKELEQLTVRTMNLNRLGFGTLSENQIGESMKAWNLSAEELGMSMDILAQVSQATGVDISQISDIATSNAGAFKELGLSHEDAIMLVGQWESAGIDTSKAIRSLDTNVAKLNAQGIDTADIMAELTGIMDDGTISAEESALMYELFGKEANDLIPALENGTISMKDFDKALGLSGQSVNEMAKANMSLGDKFKIVKNRLMTELAPALLVIGDHFITLVDWLITNFPKGVAAIQDFVNKAVTFFKDLWTKVEPVFTNLRDYFKNVIDFWVATFGAFKALFTGDFKKLWQNVRKMLSSAMKALVSLAKAGWNTFKLTTLAALRALLPAARSLAVDIGTAIKDKLKEKLDDVIDFFKKLPGRITAQAKKIGTAALDLGKDLGSAVIDGIKDGLAAAASFAGDVAAGVLKAVKDLLNTYVIDKINSAVEFTIPMPGPIPDIRINPPDIPRLQHGGHFRGGMAIVGERGPELIKLPNNMGGANVQSNRESRGLRGGVTVNVYGSTASPEQIASAVAWKMRRAG